MEPLSFSIPVQQFDLELLPLEARDIGSSAFKDAVLMYFVSKYAAKGEKAIVTVDDKDINVVSFPNDFDSTAFVQSLLQAGRIKEALPFLEALVEMQKDDAEALYNLGIAYSELGRYEDAIMRLKKAVASDPRHSNAWVGIGLAYLRMQQPPKASEAFHKAIAIDPSNGYAHRNLGGLLSMGKDYKTALPHFREAHHQLPNDPQTIYGLAYCLEQLDDLEGSDRLYQEVIQRFPSSPVAEPAREGRTGIAHKNLRANAPGGFRPDVMMYITGALDTFDKVGSRKRQEIALEIALKGQSGLDINDPTQKYTLRTLPGQFSGLHLVAIMYTAFQQIDPTANVGADFRSEYELALKTHQPKS